MCNLNGTEIFTNFYLNLHLKLIYMHALLLFLSFKLILKIINNKVKIKFFKMPIISILKCWVVEMQRSHPNMQALLLLRVTKFVKSKCGKIHVKILKL